MKKFCLRFLPLLLVAVTLLAACSKPTLLEEQNGVYFNKKTDVSYRPAPICYEAVAILKSEAVARLSRGKGEDGYLYAMQGVRTDQYVATAYNNVFYADGITLPTLREMAPTSGLFTKTNVLTAALVQIDEADVLAKMIAAYEGKGFSEDILIVDSAKRIYDFGFKFVSEKYAMFYYALEFHGYDKELTVWEPIENAEDFPILYPGVEVTTETENGYLYAVYHLGTDFLYDRENKLYYPLGDILVQYHESLDSSLGAGA